MILHKRKTTAMTRRSSSASTRSIIASRSESYDESDDLPLPKFMTGMPQWYVRAFLYGIIIVTFAMVFFMDSPSSNNSSSGLRDDPAAQVIQQQSAKPAASDHHHQQYHQQHKRSVDEHVATDQQSSSISVDQSIIDTNCRKVEHVHPNFYYCGKSYQIDSDPDDQSILRSINETINRAFTSDADGKSIVALIDAGLDDGGYVTLYSAVAGAKVFALNPRKEVETQQLELGVQANRIGQDQIEVLDGEEAMIISRLESAVMTMDFFEIVVRIDMNGLECTAFYTADTLLASPKIRTIFTYWRSGMAGKYQQCIISMISKLIANKYTPARFDRDVDESKTVKTIPLDAGIWRAWPNGYVIWTKK